jgi:hypothetical protein
MYDLGEKVPRNLGSGLPAVAYGIANNGMLHVFARRMRHTDIFRASSELGWCAPARGTAVPAWQSDATFFPARREKE